MRCWRCTARRARMAPLDRSWNLVRSWQTAEGSFRPSGQVQGGTWVTAHVVTLASVRGVYDDSVRRSVDWMLSVVGAEHSAADARGIVHASAQDQAGCFA